MDNNVDNVLVDGLVIMKIVKHCQEASNVTSTSSARGILFGLGSDDNRLEVTNAFPLPMSFDSSSDGDPVTEGSGQQEVSEIERTLNYMLRHVNIDHSPVGWYQCVNNGVFANVDFFTSYKRVRKSLPESVCLVFDMAKLKRGYLSVKAYRLSNVAFNLVSADKYFPEAVIAGQVTHDNLFEEVPVTVRNSTLVNLLLLEMSEPASHMSSDVLSSRSLASSVDNTDLTRRSHSKQQNLDLASADTLEVQVKDLIHTLDELSTEHVKYNRYQMAATKQLQEKSRYLQKRQVENSGRVARGEDPLPDEDINKAFKPLTAPERKTCLLLSSKASQLAHATERVCAETIGKWFVAEALHKGRISVDPPLPTQQPISS